MAIPTQTNLYKILQVDPQASQHVIDAAHKAIIGMYSFSSKDAQQIIHAYQTLSDPFKREEYDRQLTQTSENDLLDNRFKLIKKIGEGAMGYTYLAQHVLADEPRCIKICSDMRTDFDEILRREAKSIWNLSHWCIATIHDMFTLPTGRIALVSDYAKGMHIGAWVKEVGKMDPLDVAWIAERVINALYYLHDNHVIHGDVKPGNIIVDDDTHKAVLVDFGLAMVKPTRNSVGTGYTELFASPEQKELKRLWPQSDYYSLGLTLIYMLTGGDLDAVAKKRVPDGPQPLCSFIESLIETDIDKRPDWKKENPFETFTDIRFETFGRERSGMKKIQGKKK